MHFNEQVKVKTIKSKGKGLSLSSVDRWIGEALKSRGDDDDKPMDEDEEEEDEDGGMDDAEEEEGMVIESSSESDSDRSDAGRDAVERLKDDLFADDDDSEASKSGTLLPNVT